MSIRSRVFSRSARFGRPAIVAISVLAMFGGVFSTAGAAQAAGPNVPFPDAGLKACVLEALGAPGPEVALADLQTLTNLQCRERGIASLDGLGRASALSVLDLESNELTDPGPLAGLSELKSLDVSYNRLQGVSVLRGLPGLVVVDASYNSIGTLGDLSALAHLDRISLAHNSLSSAASFAGGAVLREVDLSYNLLADASFASRLTQVRLLSVAGNRLTSAVAFGGLSADVDLQNQVVTLTSVAVDTLQTLPVVRAVNLDAIQTKLAGDSQAYGYQTSGGFTWRSNGTGQLAWLDTRTLPAGNAVTFSGRLVQPVSRGTLTTGTPTITGSAVRGQVLKAVPGSWGPAPVALSYQWRRDGVDVAGATAATYTAVLGDMGTKLSVAVTGTKSSYSTVTTESAPTAAVLPKSLTATPKPTVGGTAAVGQTLGATAGTWTPAPVTLTYQWSRGGAPVAGATSPTYALTNADAGSTMSVTVEGSKSGYTSVGMTSAATGQVKGGRIEGPDPVIQGTPGVGKTLSVATGSWTPAPVTFTYQWSRGGTAIAGATGATYVPVTTDAGKVLTVRVTGSRSGYAAVDKTSAGVTVAIPK
ncbi:hypothetical protein B7R54_16595 [Subtercola boreus]|uniref:Fibronectin type-III domain-containing protein n=1 Tax=Subtercola boreus TaxID=120213 RepID=A0A3E0VLP7_9MICO|nr:hypothetical protein [Subtercola boreus]RFA10641.1 hypothetical protein B7R54_16595 [Subtercola boreus]TQL55802.1 leucine rich repeat (LRR) protein [Subtercola boreus]